MGRRSFALGTLWLLFGACACACACAGTGGAVREPWRGCKIGWETHKLPALQRQADPGPGRATTEPHCAPSASSGGLPDEPEAVDDLDAVLGQGLVCGPDGRASVQAVCPSLASHGWKLAAQPTAVSGAPTCSAAPATCPNRQLTIVKADEEPIELEFYDDPSSHRPPALSKCPDGHALSACYYRLGRASTQERL